MKIVDNFDLFRSIMHWESKDEFYFAQILVRGKDGHNEPGINGNNKNRMIRMYVIRSLDDLNKFESEIKAICHAINGRCYVHPTKRSFEEVADECLRITTDAYLCKANLALKSVYSTACGKTFITKDKQFVIDLDGDDVENVEKIIQFIEYHCQPFNCIKYQYSVPTAHGLHLITLPFNREKFAENYPDIDVHANSPTLLYFECND